MGKVTDTPEGVGTNGASNGLLSGARFGLGGVLKALAGGAGTGGGAVLLIMVLNNQSQLTQHNDQYDKLTQRVEVCEMIQRAVDTVANQHTQVIAAAAKIERRADALEAGTRRDVRDLRNQIDRRLQIMENRLERSINGAR
jgi:hypothetical protein